ncbi:alpha/beta hydrolase family protein [Caldilinea sp.]|uniref:alpha/beta hydrolase n=1 Tax=Caldilinea sp. TaxID=2293560 RepID=UPI002B5CE3EF|nr:esterase family protein [Anaerolineales bacterium]HQY93931.1 alpha/beta hydrolase family protein [Caldilinea sp.]
MACLQCSFFSNVLNLSVAMNVILPQPPAGASHGEHKLPVLWLLHGLSDDHTIWQRRTSIERYVEPLNLAVVMPAVDRSFYTDMTQGNRYWSYISEELPLVARSFFPLSPRREDNFVAGLSMGGYGAFKLALSHPTRYAAAASLSGALHDFAEDAAASTDPAWAAELGRIFGDLDHFTGGANDLYHLARGVAQRPVTQTQGPAPQLFQCCGTEDFLYTGNLKFKAHAEALKLPLTYEEGPGDHVWAYWDKMIQRVLAWLPIQKEIG